jgi:hypothetical protein
VLKFDVGNQFYLGCWRTTAQPQSNVVEQEIKRTVGGGRKIERGGGR